MLFIGDDHGNITILSFLKPKHSLFSKNSVDESSNYFWTVSGQIFIESEIRLVNLTEKADKFFLHFIINLIVK